MIQDYDEFTITFTMDDIRAIRPNLTDEQCEQVAYEIEGIFDDEFAKIVRNAEV